MYRIESPWFSGCMDNAQPHLEPRMAIPANDIAMPGRKAASQQGDLFMPVRMPIASLHEITLDEANAALVEWGHQMGPFNRPNAHVWCHGLHHGADLVAVTITSALVMPTAAGGFTRQDAGELARLCAARPGLCRVALRLWREFVWPSVAARQGWRWAISYQDEALHTGETYRCDGWRRVARSHSGTDRRSGRPGRDKVVWAWHPDRQLLLARAAAAVIPVKRTPRAANDAGDVAIAA